MGVSVYVPAYNAERYIEESLKSVLNQSYPIDKIIVVDDGSTDRTFEIASRLCANVIRHDKNRGIAASRNTAVTAIGSEFVASIDADCIAERDWLKESMRHFSDLRVVGVGGRVIEKINSLCDEWRAVNLRQNRGGSEVMPVAFLAGCNTVYRKEALSRAGLYDIRFKTYHEDTEIAQRLLGNNGNILIYAPRAVVQHLKMDSLFSVMNTCWHFRHRYPPRTLKEVIADTLVEFCHMVASILRDNINGRLSLIPIDSVYFPFQFYFNVKYYLRNKYRYG